MEEGSKFDSAPKTIFLSGIGPNNVPERTWFDDLLSTSEGKGIQEEKMLERFNNSRVLAELIIDSALGKYVDRENLIPRVSEEAAEVVHESERLVDTCDRARINLMDPNKKEEAENVLASLDIKAVGEARRVLNEYYSAEANRIFREAAVGAITELVVHGTITHDKEKNEILLTRSDTDGKGFVALCQMVGLGEVAKKLVEVEDKATGSVDNVEVPEYKVTYMNPGTYPYKDRVVDPTSEGKGTLAGDLGGVDVEYSKVRRLAVFDHHSEISPENRCATVRIYEALTDCGLLDKTAELDVVVNFVSGMDDSNYPRMHELENFENSYRTLIGLHDFLEFSEIREALEVSKGDPFAVISKELINKWDATRRADARKNGSLAVTITDRIHGKGHEVKRPSPDNPEIIEKVWKQDVVGLAAKVERSRIEVQRLIGDGFVAESVSGYGKVLVDIDGKVPCGSDAAFAYGDDIDTYISWSPDKNGFAIFSRNKKIDDDFNGTIKVRDRMRIKPKSDVPLNIGLEEILSRIGVDPITYSENLKNYIDTKKMPEPEKKETEAEMVKRAIEEAIEWYEKMMEDLKRDGKVSESMSAPEPPKQVDQDEGKRKEKEMQRQKQLDAVKDALDRASGKNETFVSI